MPTLSWVGKDAVIKQHRDVPFRLLEPMSDLGCGPADSGNLIVQGDNLPPDTGLNATDAAAKRLGARTARKELAFMQTPYALDV